MRFFDRFKRKAEPEKRAYGSGYTSQIIGARQAYITGAQGAAELTGTVQTCVSLWEGGLTLAAVEGTELLDRRTMGLVARSLALRGEALFVIDGDMLLPCSDWDVTTSLGVPRAYRASIANAGGGISRTALAEEVLHFRIGSDVSAPYLGNAPLRRASLSAGMLHSVEAALAEVFENAPIGTQIVPMPETSEVDLEDLGRDMRGQRGRILLRESVNVAAAGGPAPAQDWKPADVTPNLEKSMSIEALTASQNSIASAFGVLPGLLNPATTGPMVRECQRHLAQWTLQPIAALIAEEATAKLGAPVSIDTMQPLQAYDAGGRARALTGVVQALAAAKEAGLDAGDVQLAHTFAGTGG